MTSCRQRGAKFMPLSRKSCSNKFGAIRSVCIVRHTSVETVTVNVTALTCPIMMSLTVSCVCCVCTDNTDRPAEVHGAAWSGPVADASYICSHCHLQLCRSFHCWPHGAQEHANYTDQRAYKECLTRVCTQS